MSSQVLSGRVAVALVREASKRLTRASRRRAFRQVVGGLIVGTTLLSAVALLGIVLKALGSN